MNELEVFIWLHGGFVFGTQVFIDRGDSSCKVILSLRADGRFNTGYHWDIGLL